MSFQTIYEYIMGMEKEEEFEASVECDMLLCVRVSNHVVEHTKTSYSSL